MARFDEPVIKDGERLAAGDISDALTKELFIYADGATQVFTPDGRTTYTENGSATFGEWGVDARGQFWSFWPPTYRATYDLSWIVDSSGVVGVQFTDPHRGATSTGRYNREQTGLGLLEEKEHQD